MAKNDYEFKLDTKDFDTKINKILKSFPDFLEKLLKNLGLRLIAKVKKLTPKISGLLQKSWFLNSPKITKNNAEIEIKNNVKYAMAVEFGHKQEPGRYVAAIGKRLKKSFVPGKFMLKQSMKQLESEAPKIIESEIQKFIDKNGGGK